MAVKRRRMCSFNKSQNEVICVDCRLGKSNGFVSVVSPIGFMRVLLKLVDLYWTYLGDGLYKSMVKYAFHMNNGFPKLVDNQNSTQTADIHAVINRQSDQRYAKIHAKVG